MVGPLTPPKLKNPLPVRKFQSVYASAAPSTERVTSVTPQEPPLPQEPKPKVAETGGFITNLPKSTINLAKSVLLDLPITALTTAYNYAKDPAQYARDVKLFFNDPGPVGTIIRKSITDRYTEDLWYNFNDDPASFLSDAATVLSAGGLAVGKLGKFAGLSEKAAKVGAKGLAKASRAIDPSIWVTKAAGKLASPIAESLGYGKHSQTLTKGEVALRNAAQADLHADGLRVLMQNLNDADGAIVTRHTMLGNVDELAALKSTRPDLYQRVKAWKRHVEDVQEPFMMGDESGKLVGSKAAIRAKLVGMKYYLKKFEGKDVSIKEVAQMYRSGKYDPTFTSMFTKSDGPDVFSILNDDYYRGGSLSRAEKRSGALEYLTDPDIIQARQMAAFRDVQYKMGLIRLVKAEMRSAGDLRVAKNAAEEKALYDAGFRPLQDAYYEKYWKDTAEGVQIIGDSLKKGGQPIKTLEEAKGVLQAMQTDHGRFVSQAGAKLWVPKHVQAWLHRRLAPISKAERVYSDVLGRLKSAFTVFNPRFWGGVVFGNALLALFYGVRPGKSMRRTLAELPEELYHLARNDAFMKDVGGFTRVATRLGEFAHKLDILYKTGIYSQEAIKEFAALKETGAHFFKAFQTESELLSFLAKKPREYAETLAKIERFRLEIAQRVEQLRGLSKVESRTGQRLSKAAAMEGPPPATIADDVYGPGQKVDEVYPAGSSTKKVDGERPPFTAGEPSQGKVDEIYPNAPYQSKVTAKQERIKEVSDVMEADVQKRLDMEADVLARMVELGELERRMPELQVFRDAVDRAIETANRFFPSYDRLPPFEQRTIRQLVPFWTFTKGMTKLAAQLPYLYPKRMFLYHHLISAWKDIFEDPNSFTPKWIRDYIPVATFVDERGEPKIVGIRLSSLSPINNVKMSNLAGFEIPSGFDFLRQNPFISIGMDLVGSVPRWSGKPLSAGVSATRLDNGEVWKYDGKTFKRTVATPSIAKALYSLFPQSQLVESLFQRYVQTDRGWVLNPDPITQGGKPLIQRSWLERLTSLVIPTTSYNLDKLRQREKMYIQRIIRSFSGELARANPVKRQNILTILEDFRNGQIQKYLER